MIDSPDDDRRLVAAYLSARTDASFLPLYRRHTPRLYRAVLRMAGGREAEADEVVQEAWTRALAGVQGFGWQSTFVVWLHGIAINCLRERRRSTERERQLDVERQGSLPAADPDEGSDAAFGEVPLDVLEKAIAKLPLGYREALVLHDVEGHTHAQVADMLGISPGTSKSQLTRARRRLRAMLEPRLRRSGELS